MSNPVSRKRGDTRYIYFVAKSRQTGAAVDISSNYSFLLTVNSEENPANADNQLFQVVGDIIDGANGVYGFKLTTGQADQTPGTYYYDVQMTDPNALIDTLEKDTWTVEQDITK